MNGVIKGNQQVLAQMIALIKPLSVQDYCAVSTPCIDSSIGQHLRHSIDFYQALERGLCTGWVDYDVRRRGNLVERQPGLALKELSDINGWISALTQPAALPLRISSKMTLNERNVAGCDSSLARELAFVCLHAVHHLSMMVIIARMAGYDIDAEFGLAPATASVLRQQRAP